MKMLIQHDAAVAHWVAERISYTARRIPDFEPGQVFGPSTAIGVLSEEGQLIGGVVYHAYDPYCRSIEMSFAATTPRWLTRPIICAMLNYPFQQLGCQRITAATPQRATSARRFLDTFGFKREGVVRKGFGDDNAIISGLLKHEWERSRWVLPPSPQRRSLREARRGKEVRPEVPGSGRAGERADGFERQDG